MSPSSHDQNDHLDDDQADGQVDGQNPEELEGEGEEEDDHKAGSGIAGWPISLAIHGLVALIFCYIVFAAHKDEEELAPMRVTTMDPPPKKEEKKEQRDVEAKVDVNVETVADVAAPVTQLDVKVEEVSQSEEDNDAQVNKGREEAVSASETGGQGAFMAIGAGGGSAGMFGSRSGGGKHRALAKGGGTRASESAVDAALRWFKKHQSPNGMWDPEKYPVNCQENPKCEPGSTADVGGSDAGIAMTGYAVLCFLGAGYDHKTPSKFKTTVQKGLEYLRSVQKPDGLLGVRNYEHGVATMAMAEAYAMTTDADLKGPAQKGVKVILDRQAKDGSKDADKAYSGLGWDYEAANPARNDSSVSGWCVMALKSALAGGLNVGTGMEGAKKWLEKAWKAANKDWMKLTDPYSATSQLPLLLGFDHRHGADRSPGQPDARHGPGGCAVRGVPRPPRRQHHARVAVQPHHEVPVPGQVPDATPTTCTTTPWPSSRPVATAGSAGTTPSATCWSTPSARARTASTAAGMPRARCSMATAWAAC